MKDSKENAKNKVNATTTKNTGPCDSSKRNSVKSMEKEATATITSIHNFPTLDPSQMGRCPFNNYNLNQTHTYLI